MAFFAPRISMRLIDEIDRLAQRRDRPADNLSSDRQTRRRPGLSPPEL
jgi:hypothetical protein